jgi:hypothetical protein
MAESCPGQVDSEKSNFIVRFKDDSMPGDNMLLDVFDQEGQVFLRANHLTCGLESSVPSGLVHPVRVAKYLLYVGI